MRSDTVCTLRWEAPFLLDAALDIPRSRNTDRLVDEAKNASGKLAEALARDVAWVLPRRVALWAFIRVCAEPGVSPDEITYASAYDAWVARANVKAS